MSITLEIVKSSVNSFHLLLTSLHFTDCKETLENEADDIIHDLVDSQVSSTTITTVPDLTWHEQTTTDEEISSSGENPNEDGSGQEEVQAPCSSHAIQENSDNLEAPEAEASGSARGTANDENFINIPNFTEHQQPALPVVAVGERAADLPAATLSLDFSQKSILNIDDTTLTTPPTLNEMPQISSHQTSATKPSSAESANDHKVRVKCPCCLVN